MTLDRQPSALPPVQPIYIFRGHTSQIHSVDIVHRNTGLVTGDADGWIVYWRLESKRPVAVWRAHDAAILGTAEWGFDKLITHGRDNALRIWQLGATDESILSTVLPADSSSAHRPKPWLLHALPVNTLNFCAFSMCHEHEQPAANRQRSDGAGLDQGRVPSTGLSESILVAVPARDDKKIEVYQFPDEKLVSVVPRVQPIDTGMVMAVKLTHHRPSNNIIVIAGYEGGFTAVHLLDHSSRATSQRTGKPIPDFAQIIYLSQPHTHPVLSLDTTPDANMYFTSSADAAITVHRIPETLVAKTSQDLDASEQSTSSSLTLREQSDASRTSTAFVTSSSHGLNSTRQAESSDQGTAAATSYEPLTFSKMPVAKSTANSPLSFSKQSMTPSPSPEALNTNSKSTGLSSLLSSAPPQPKIKPSAPPVSNITVQPAYRTVQTKHAGQQSLRVRSDGRLLVTGGWDSRVRVYSTKTLKELAVLKWHKEGVYAVGFGDILDGVSIGKASHSNGMDDTSREMQPQGRRVLTGLTKLQRQREEQIQIRHWIAAGAKDGKVSLWEVF